MAAPTFKKATDSDAGDATKYGAPDVKYIEDVLDATHATDRIQITAIEGFAIHIPITMMVAEGTNAYPDIHALATGGETGDLGLKLSGWVLPNGAGVKSKINWKLAHPIPATVPTSPVYTVRTTIMTMGAVAGPKTLHMELMYNSRADGEDADVVFTDDIGDQTVTMPTSTEYFDVMDLVLGTDPAVGDYVYGQLIRDSSQAEDDFTDDILIVNMCMIITAG